MALSHLKPTQRRAARVRLRLKKTGAGRPRLSVFRSAKNIYAQVIDDARGVTLAHASTLEAKGEKGADKDAAARVGALIAKRALDKGVKEVVFDRGAYLFHGRVKALADAAREAGLSF
jgi:large subunit ribosomal protein L18